MAIELRSARCFRWSLNRFAKVLWLSYVFFAYVLSWTWRCYVPLECRSSRSSSPHRNLMLRSVGFDSGRFTDRPDTGA